MKSKNFNTFIKNDCILGIDPGTKITGYGVIRLGSTLEVLDFGTISPSYSKKMSERYKLIFEGISELLEQYKPIALAVETQFVNKNVSAAMKLGMARGMALLAATLKNVSVFEYSPSRAKKAVVGNGAASKLQVQGMVKTLLSLPQIPEPEDAADALALAICHANTLKFQKHHEFLI